MYLNTTTPDFIMALAQSVDESLKEASSHLRNALAFAARGERIVVCKQIANILVEIEQIGDVDGLLDTLDSLKERMEQSDE